MISPSRVKSDWLGISKTFLTNFGTIVSHSLTNKASSLRHNFAPLRLS